MDSRNVTNGLRKILEYTEDEELEAVERKVSPFDQRGRWSRSVAIDSILKYASHPSEILNRKALRKDTIRIYLARLRLPLDDRKKKRDFVQTCLDHWGVRDDNFGNFLTQGQIKTQIRRLEEKRDEDINKLRAESEAKLKEDIESVRERFRNEKRRLEQRTTTGHGIATLFAPHFALSDGIPSSSRNPNPSNVFQCSPPPNRDTKELFTNMILMNEAHFLEAISASPRAPSSGNTLQRSSFTSSDAVDVVDISSGSGTSSPGGSWYTSNDPSTSDDYRAETKPKIVEGLFSRRLS